MTISPTDRVLTLISLAFRSLIFKSLTFITPDTSKSPIEAFSATIHEVLIVDALRFGCDQLMVVRLEMVAYPDTDKLMKLALSLLTFEVVNTISLDGTPPKTLLVKLIIYKVNIL